MTDYVNVGLVMGDAAGIGSELALKTLTDPALDARVSLTVFGSAENMTTMNGIMGSPVEVVTVDPADIGRNGAADDRRTVRVVECDIAANPDFKWGVADAINGANTVNAIHRALGFAQEGMLDGVVIGPLDKHAMNLGGSKFPDEATLMASITDTPLVKIIPKWNDIFRTSVVGHVRFRDIPDFLTPERIEVSIRALDATMRQFGVVEPRLGVAGLNPHAGEGGEFGDEEIVLLAPLIEKLAATGLRVSGPYPCDTILHRALRGEFEGLVFMYHDQGNLPLKAASFGESVLIYSGLPVPVTGVGHGVAYGRAGQNRADHLNLLMAVNAAAEMAATRRGRPAAG